MKTWLNVLGFVFALLPVLLCADEKKAPGYEPQEGDIVFQSLPHAELVDCIEGSTHSPFSHCGIVTRHKRGEWVVLEAIGPVMETPLRAWTTRGRGQQMAVYRLKPEFQPQVPAMITAARQFLNLPYDIQYELDDEKIYCSELIYKAFAKVKGGALGKLQSLRDLDWKPYEKTIRSISGGLPLDRLMITPRALSEAEQLDCVVPWEQPKVLKKL